MVVKKDIINVNKFKNPTLNKYMVMLMDDFNFICAS